MKLDLSPKEAVMSIPGSERRHWWWLSNRKVVEKYVREARVKTATTRDPSHVNTALSLLDAALALSPRFELALELRARCLLYLRRFKEVVEMLQDYIPSNKAAAVAEEEDADDDSSGSSSSDHSWRQLCRERVNLLDSSDSENDSVGFKCFSVSELKRNVLPKFCKNESQKENPWRYLLLGRACCHMGLMEDSILLLTTGKRLLSAVLRRESTSYSDDCFHHHHHLPNNPSSSSELESTSLLLTQIKLLLRRRTAAIAALDAGLHSESIRHFSKILDSRRPAPQPFLADCFLLRSSAYRASNRIADSIADCNHTLALDPSSVPALHARAALFELVGCVPDALHDLEHLKLILNSVLRDRKLPGWRPQRVRYRDVPGKLSDVKDRIGVLKNRMADGSLVDVDYYKLFGLRRGCSRSELERANVLLVIRHKPDKAVGFVDRCELVDGTDYESVRDRARFSAALLYRLIQKGYKALMAVVMVEEVADDRGRMANQANVVAEACRQQHYSTEA